tara:strand:- start:1878 stop:2048 length:171 start_codon:yes stop_codon:yes gene_type:complete
MIIESITVHIFNEDDMLNENVEVKLFPDSGDDIYPDGVELTEEMIEKINNIRNQSF